MQMEIHKALNLLLVVKEELSHLCTIIVTFFSTSHLWTHALFILKRENIGLFCIKQDISNSLSSSSSKQRKREILPSTSCCPANLMETFHMYTHMLLLLAGTLNIAHTLACTYV